MNPQQRAGEVSIGSVTPRVRPHPPEDLGHAALHRIHCSSRTTLDQSSCYVVGNVCENFVLGFYTPKQHRSSSKHYLIYVTRRCVEFIDNAVTTV